MKNNRKKILVCDFGASLNYTHHLQYVRSNVMFMKRNYPNASVGVIIPVASEIKPSEFGPADFTRRFLWPVFYFPHTKISLMPTWFTFFWKKLGKLVCKFNHKLYVYLSVVLVLPFFVFCRANLIVFPTVCAQSLKLIEILEFLHVKKSFNIHFSNSAEIRPPYGSFKNCEDFIKKSNKFKSVDIALSFESQTLLNFYSGLNVKQNYFLARPPSTNDSIPLFFKSPNISKKSVIKVLIMGRPANPGRDSLILKSLEKFKNDIRHIDVLKDNFFEFGVTIEDSSLVDTLNNSNTENFSIKKLPNTMSYSNLVSLLNTATLIVLPYNPDGYYSLNHSGMFFLSSDLQLPIVTCENACFSNETIDFKLGKLFDFKTTFTSALIETLTNLNNFKFEEYFKVREQENIKVYEYLKF